MTVHVHDWRWREYQSSGNPAYWVECGDCPERSPMFYTRVALASWVDGRGPVTFGGG